MEKKIKLLPPEMPNFIAVQGNPGKRQDGIKIGAGSIPITDLTEDEAMEYADYIKQTFMNHWRNKKAKI
jgi:alkanesulfonate monooxygenase SsuD/methylene tetrahydromethanopterin reductase-like flavin-dependent oxidoreductase (luciferase family)